MTAAKLDNSESLSLLATRRSQNTMAMTGPGPLADELATMLRLAARVPDHGKLAPWRFLIIDGAGRNRAGEVCARVWAQKHPTADAKRLSIEMSRFLPAPLIVCVVSRAAPHVKIPEWEQVLSAGAVCMNLTIAACAMGFVTNWMTDWVAYDRDAMREFGLADHENIAGFIYIGHVAERAEDRIRPDMDAIVQRF